MSQSMRALILRKVPAAAGQSVYHDAIVQTVPVPEIGEGQVLVKVSAAAFNHRDLWMRKGLYPRIQYGGILGADAIGTVISAYNKEDNVLNKRVFLSPVQKWDDGPAPSTKYGVPDIPGCSTTTPSGVFADYFVADRQNVVPVPDYLTDEQAAAWPVAGITAWRACIINANVQPGDNVLITGIGGGVAIIALQICVARGANVYVTSSSEEKIKKAIQLGAKAGVSYKSDNWPAQIASLLEKTPRYELDSVIDGAGGEIFTSISRFLKTNGRVVCYGMTVSTKITMTMREVLRNQQLIGSTMGSLRDFVDATNFIAEHKIRPIVSHILGGLDAAEEGFELIKSGDQFGKIVIRMSQTERSGQTTQALL